MQFLTALSAALSVSAAIILVSWPYLQRDQLSARMAHVAAERERIRIRERGRLNNRNAKVSLRHEPKRLFKEIVDRLDLSKQAESDDLALMLRQAGYRGRGPIIAFLAIRHIAPIGMLLLAALYVFVLLNVQQPLAMKLLIVAVAGGSGFYAPKLYIKNRITKRQAAIRRSWPDALDLLLICVECGMSIDSSFRKVAEEIGLQSPELAEELSLTTAELSYLQDRRRAFENLGDRTGLEGVKAVVTSLVQAEKYGTSLGQSLRVLAQENRDMRMAEAEKKAASLPPKLTVPMILFFLPVLFVAILSPAAISYLGLH
ncbi:type II secretion system F family protein [Microvirga sp. M2]